MAKAPAKKKRGPDPWEPTAEERATVEHLTAQGFTQDQIAGVLKKSIDSLDRHCRDELDHGATRQQAKVAGALYKKAMKGDTAAIIWYEKTRSGRTDKQEVNLNGSIVTKIRRVIVDPAE